MSSTPAIPLPDRGTEGGRARDGVAEFRDDDRESTGVDAENGLEGRRGEYGDLGKPGESIRSCWRQQSWARAMFDALAEKNCEEFQYRVLYPES